LVSLAPTRLARERKSFTLLLDWEGEGRVGEGRVGEGRGGMEEENWRSFC